MVDLQEDRLSIETAVAGVSYRQEAVSRCYEGQSVQLVRDSSNVHDKNAIEVHAGEQIGFIPRDFAETLALYLDYFQQDTVEAKIENLTGGAGQEKGIGVVIEITVSESLYNIVEEDPDFVRNSIISKERAAEIDASLTEEEVQKYIQDVDDRTLDVRYWIEQQNKWEKEQKEKARKRLGRELESYEESEIEEKAEIKFEEYRQKHPVTSYDRQKIRNAMTREDVVYSILSDQDMKNIEKEINEEIEKEQTQENKNIVAGLVIFLVFVAIIVVISVG